MSNVESEKYRAPALDKGLDILEFLAAAPNGLTQVEIAKGLGRGPNEIYRMLNTLVRRNYVTSSPEGDKYMLSLKLLMLANAHPPRRRLLDIAEPLMRKVAQESEQSCQLATWEDGDVVITSAISAPGNWRLALRTGASIGVYNTGSGRVLSAFQTADIREKMLNDHQLVKGEESIDASEFEQILARIRADGYAHEPSQTIRGVTNLSFPILDLSGSAIAALSCPFIERIDVYNAPELDQVTDLFARAAKEIGRQISGKQSVGHD